MNKAEITKIPFFFIIGRSRSGTTLLMSLFDAHPNVIMPFESPYIWVYRKKYGRLKYWKKSDLLSFYEDLFRTNWKFNSWNINQEKLKTDLLSCEGETDYLTVCKVVHSNFISVFPKQEIRLIGDKTPKYAVKFDKIIELFPEAKYVHLIRDYRDHMVSMLKLNFLDSVVPEIIHQWKYSAEMAEKLIKKHPEKILCIRYEDLVTEPVKVFGNVCNFLSIPFDQNVMDFYKKGESITENIKSDIFPKYMKSLFEPIDSRHLNSWENKLSEETLSLAECILGETGERFGYTKSKKHLPGRIKAKYYQRVFIIRIFYAYLFLLNRLPVGIKKAIIQKWANKGKFYYFFFPAEKKAIKLINKE